jgi:hypothetical protein
MRVYMPQIDLMLPRIDAEKFFEAGGVRVRKPAIFGFETHMPRTSERIMDHLNGK